MSYLEAFRVDTNLLSAHLANEERAKSIASQLVDVISMLTSSAPPESFTQYRRLYSKADSMYRYCRKMVDAQDEMLAQARWTAMKINDIFEQSIVEAQRTIPDFEGLPR